MTKRQSNAEGRCWTSPSPERTFVGLALAFGLAFVFVSPPMMPPDEARHLIRAFLVAEGRFTVPGQQPGREATVPANLVPLPPRHVRIAFAQRAPPGYTIDDMRKALREPLSSRRIPAKGRTSLYSPVAYAPQALGIAIARALDLAPVGLTYVGRIANLLAWIAATALALHLLPFRRWALFVLVLAPMSVHQAASLSADAPTQAVALLVVALPLRIAFGEDGVRRAHVAGLLAVSLLLGLVKPGYWPLVALALWIPRERFGSARTRWLLLVALATLCLIPSLLWALTLGEATEAQLHADARPAQQLAYIRDSPLSFLWLALRTLSAYSVYYLKGIMGVLGPLYVSLPGFVYAAWWAFLLGATHLDGPDPATLSVERRVALVGLFFLGAVGILALVYLNWNAPDVDLIASVQGRYLTPFLPLVLLAWPARRALPVRIGPWLCTVACAATLAVAIHAMIAGFW
jgi:uncharacterized membrane protein